MEEPSGKLRLRHLPERDENRLFGAPLQNDEFNFLLLESVDESLADLLGRRSRDLIYDHLATRYRYGREEVPGKIDEFYEFLENTFSSASRTIGRTIIRRLCGKLGYEFVHVPHFEFFDYLEALRARAEREAETRRRTSQDLTSGP